MRPQEEDSRCPLGYRRLMSRRERLIDAGLTFGLLTLGQVEAWTTTGLDAPRPAAASVAAAVTLALLARRRFPLSVLVWVLLILLAGAIAWPGINDQVFPGPVVMLAIYSAGRYCEPRAAIIAAILVFIQAVLSTAAEGWGGLGNFLGNVVFVLLLFGIPFAAGRLVRSRQELVHEVEAGSEARARAAAGAAAAEERMRIARELHDVVGHALSVIVVQAGVERKLVGPAGGSTHETLETIEGTARGALAEMRRLVGMLRTEEDGLPLSPQPRVREIGALVEQVRAAGLRVDLQVEGEPTDVPSGVDLSAYRIVQEALTNAVRHAGPASVRVLIRYAPTEITLEIDDDGRGPSGRGEGHGLAGMRERVSVLGGSIRTGVGEDGGYAVHVRLPLAT